jgi:hypothetical protein
MNGAARVLVRAYAIALIPSASTPTPNSLNRRANRGKIITWLVIWSAMQVDSTTMAFLEFSLLGFAAGAGVWDSE